MVILSSSHAKNLNKWCWLSWPLPGVAQANQVNSMAARLSRDVCITPRSNFFLSNSLKPQGIAQVALLSPTDTRKFDRIQVPPEHNIWCDSRADDGARVARAETEAAVEGWHKLGIGDAGLI